MEHDVMENHEYTLSEPTAVANIAAWIHLRALPYVDDSLPQGSSGTWKKTVLP